MALIGVASGDWHSKDGKTVWGGSGWARLGQYIEHLDQFDWVVGTLVWDHDQFKIVDEHENTHSPDALFLHRLMHKGLVDHIKLARKAGQKILNDLDDWYWGLDPRNQAFTASHPKHNDREDRYSYRSIISNSDLLIVSTKYLASRVDWVKAPITIVENTVDVGRHTPVAMHDDTVPLVGWVGSTNHRSGDLETMRGILSPLWRNGEIRLQHSGFHSSMRSFAEAIGVPEAAIEVRLPLSSHADYPSLLTMDVGIVPLRNAPFNQSKCVDANTRIPTDRGVILARELRVGDSVTYNGSWCTIKGMEKSVSRPGLQFTLEDGYVIKITPEHRMFVNSEFKEARDIQLGDLFTLQDSPTSATYQTVPWPSASRASRKVESDHYAYVNASSVPRLTIDERWGRFLGAFAGDGHLSKTAISISCDGQDQDWIDFLIEDFKEMGLTAGTEQHTMFDGTVLRRRSVRIASADMVRTLELLGLTQISAVTQKNMRKVCVPEVIWRSPSSVVAEFLSAYFEADGWTSGTGVHASSKSEEFIRAVQTLLLVHFGIVSKVFPKQHKSQTQEGTYWHISLSRAAADVFEKMVGFKSQRKINRLRTITEKPHSNAYRPMTYEKKVVDIQPCFIECPVDIEVEGSVFIAAGMVSHNSYIKGLEYAASGIPFVAQDLDAYRQLRSEYGIGLTAAKPADWIKLLKRMKEPGFRAEHGAINRERVWQRDLAVGVKEMADALASVL